MLARILMKAFAVAAGTGLVASIARGEQCDLNIIMMDNWAVRASAELSTVATSAGLSVKFEPDLVQLRKFIDGESQLVAWATSPSDLKATQWVYGIRADNLKDCEFVVGQSRLLVIVNSAILQGLLASPNCSNCFAMAARQYHGGQSAAVEGISSAT